MGSSGGNSGQSPKVGVGNLHTIRLAKCMSYVICNIIHHNTYVCVCWHPSLWNSLFFWGGSAWWWGRPGCREEQHPRLRSCCVLSGASGWCPYMYGACASFVRLHAHTLPQMLCLYGNQWPYPDLLLLCSPHFLIVDVDAVYAMCWMFSKDYVSTYFYIPQFGKSNQFWMYSEDSLTRHRGGSWNACWVSQRTDWQVVRIALVTHLFENSCPVLVLLGQSQPKPMKMRGAKMSHVQPLSLKILQRVMPKSRFPLL